MHISDIVITRWTEPPCSLSVVWVTVQILPVIREQSLKQPPSLSLSIPAFQVRGNVRPNTHQGVLSLPPTLPTLSSRSETESQRSLPSRTHSRPQVTRAAFYLREPPPLKNGGFENPPLHTVGLHADMQTTRQAYIACACVADKHIPRAALIIATHNILHRDVHCLRQHWFTWVYMVSVCVYVFLLTAGWIALKNVKRNYDI